MNLKAVQVENSRKFGGKKGELVQSCRRSSKNVDRKEITDPSEVPFPR